MLHLGRISIVRFFCLSLRSVAAFLTIYVPIQFDAPLHAITNAITNVSGQPGTVSDEKLIHHPTTTNAAQTHGAATFGALKYSSGFTHFDYVNPDAPKGGDFAAGEMGTFDSFNPFIVMGTPFLGAYQTFATLLTQAADETGSHYAYVADSVQISVDRTTVTFHINPAAAFDSGEKITADDVIFSFNSLREKGSPAYRTYYKDVTRVEKIDAATITFHLADPNNRELPIILGQIPVLSKRFFDKRDFAKVLLTPAPASGPYKITKIDFGRRVILERVKGWWGENISSQKGMHNFDRLIIDYYRDSNTLFEAFKAGKIDYRYENSAKQWINGYSFDAVKNGLVKKYLVVHQNPRPTQGFVFNLRRDLFKHPAVRRALSNLFDFEWLNKNMFNGQYQRNHSFFPNSVFEQAHPFGERENAIIAKIHETVKEKITPVPIVLTAHNTPHENRRIRQESLVLLAEAGWHLVNGKLVNNQTKKPFVIHYIGADPALEKIILNFKRQLAKIGIDLNVRTMDVTGYMERIENYDFDMAPMVLGQSIMPGNEQRMYFGSKAVDAKGGMNLAGVRDPTVDALCDMLVDAKDFETLTAIVRVLDRVLMSLHIMIPHWHRNDVPHANWERFGKPKVHPPYALQPLTQAWWLDHAKDQLVQRVRKGNGDVKDIAAPITAASSAHPNMIASTTRSVTAQPKCGGVCTCLILKMKQMVGLS